MIDANVLTSNDALPCEPLLGVLDEDRGYSIVDRRLARPNTRVRLHIHIVVFLMRL